MYTNEQIDQLRALIAMMKESGVSNFIAGDVHVHFSVVPHAPVEISVEEKLELLKADLKQASADSDADLLWSVT